MELTDTNRPCGLTTMLIQAPRGLSNGDIAISATRARPNSHMSLDTYSQKEDPTFSCRSLDPVVSLEPKRRDKVSGRHSEGETPVPIPNTAVKPFSADGTVSDGVMGE